MTFVDGIEHGGYVLACEGVAIEACREEADRVASDLGDDRRVRWMVIRPDGHEACWTGPLLATCERLTDTPVRRFHDPG
jgi:hypothetical protein